jgi:hypothetical protein
MYNIKLTLYLTNEHNSRKTTELSMVLGHFNLVEPIPDSYGKHRKDLIKK